MMNDLKKTATIARYTFAEIYKSKIMINIILIGLGILLVSFIATEFTYGVPARIALDFGMGSLSLVSICIAIFMGVTIISKEVDSRTIYMVISRPVSRTSFLMGRIIGMGGILFINVLVLGFFTLLMFLKLNGEFSTLIFWSLVFSFFESFLVLLIVVFFSLVTNNVLAIMYSLVLLILGHAINDTLMISLVKNNDILSFLVKSYSVIFPNFSKINIKDFLLYKQSLPSEYTWMALIYAIIYSMMISILSILIFKRKNLN